MPDLEAKARETKAGLVHDESGWFVVNARDERWNDTGPFGLYANFEGKRSFPQLGFNISVGLLPLPAADGPRDRRSG